VSINCERDEGFGQANLSAKKNSAKARARVSGAHGWRVGSKCHSAAAPQGTQASNGRLVAISDVGAANESYRLHRRHRLVANGDFRRVRNEGRSWPHPLLVLYVRPRPEPVTRLGIVVSKQVGGAVTRNRVKRRIREILRHRLPGIRPGFDTVWIARKRSSIAGYGDLEAAIDQLLRRSGLREI
jgi:ribonuclease P protein component